jgi:hypothetical protein
MRVELTGAERARLQALFDEIAPGERSSDALPPGLAARWRQATEAIARARGLHPADTRFCTEPATGVIWIEVRPNGAAARATMAARFTEAIDAFAVGELELEIEPPAAARLAAKLAAGGPILAGERHGVEQNPLVAYTLMRRLGLRVLALEWSIGLQAAVDAFLDGEALDVDVLADSTDGRITAGHFAVLRSMRRDGLLDRVVLFDPEPWPRTWSERDWGMAVRLLQENARPPAFVMAGSLHTRLRRHRHGEPMGAHVARARSGTLEVRLRYPGGPLATPSGACVLRSAGAWLELTVPDARPAVTPAARDARPP